jgi:hypothetical protein
VDLEIVAGDALPATLPIYPNLSEAHLRVVRLPGPTPALLSVQAGHDRYVGDPPNTRTRMSSLDQFSIFTEVSLTCSMIWRLVIVSGP